MKENFLDYIREVFIPAVKNDCQLPGCQGKQKWGWPNRGLFRQEFHDLTQQPIPQN
jgi:hypothetical protein